ncbi:uncharacterized protein VTP21DRAFT_6955 [Calcarisporiella thermophila]|uniref:uncharacterized protein n=1 Tax=Calcarisporiella thermophila TaxID=911321 RepID=UPI0037426407
MQTGSTTPHTFRPVTKKSRKSSRPKINAKKSLQLDRQQDLSQYGSDIRSEKLARIEVLALEADQQVDTVPDPQHLDYDELAQFATDLDYTPVVTDDEPAVSAVEMLADGAIMIDPWIKYDDSWWYKGPKRSTFKTKQRYEEPRYPMRCLHADVAISIFETSGRLVAIQSMGEECRPVYGHPCSHGVYLTTTSYHEVAWPDEALDSLHAGERRPWFVKAHGDPDWANFFSLAAALTGTCAYMVGRDQCSDCASRAAKESNCAIVVDPPLPYPIPRWVARYTRPEQGVSAEMVASQIATQA